MQINITKTTILLTIFFLLGLPVVSAAQSGEVFTLSADNLANGKTIELDKTGWRFHAGDDLNWANPNFDDSAWQTLDDSALAVDKLSETDWRGIGWFRLRVQISPDAEGAQLALQMWHWGASEIYLDGKLINRFGTVGTSADSEQAYNPNGVPIGISFGASGEHIIAVRHSVSAYQNLSSSAWSRWLAAQESKYLKFRRAIYYGAGFRMSLSPSASALNYTQVLLYGTGGVRLFRVGMFLSIGLLFLLMYFFYPRQRDALFFAVFALLTCVSIFSNLLAATSHLDLAEVEIFQLFNEFSYLIENFFLLLFLYSAFSFRIPRYFWAMAAIATAATFFLIITEASIGLKIVGVTEVFFVIETLRVIVIAFRQKKEGAWILGIGFLFFSPQLIYSGLIDLGITEELEALSLIVRQSVISMVVAVTIYLARQFARTNKNLEEQLVREVEHEKDKARLLLVEAENERRAKELEEARQLQLSMLPKKLPNIAGLEIAAYMKPATEVGGDYYDFHVSDDGTLTVVVGDATGHGLKAGTMVTAAKTLFNNLASEPNIESIFKQSSAALKKLNLRGMFMALTMAKIENNRLRLSCAGMPSALIYRSAVGAVEEISIRAVPLGSLAKTNYPQRETALAKDDVVVLMSDGFPEMFNPANEMLGFEKAAEILPEIAALSSQEIINHFVNIGENWANGRAQDDDVTFVVLKVKTDDDGNF